MKDVPPDWRSLSNILQELTSFNHRLRRAFNNSYEITSALTNAVRSGVVAVRGRRHIGSAFDRMEKYLSPTTDIDISLNWLALRPQTKSRTVLDSMNISDGGAIKCFTDVQADLRGVENWISENALPRGWLEASTEVAAALESTGVNERKRAAVLQAIDSLGREKLNLMSQKDREAEIINMVADNNGLPVSGRYVRMLFRNVPK